MARKMLIAIVLDSSGSMKGCRSETISGFNEYISSQREKAIKDGNVTLVTLTQFGDSHQIVHSAISIADLPELTEENYKPDGMTCLLDALGSTLKSIDEDLSRETETPGVLVVVITDGQENSSKEYTMKTISEMVIERKAKGNFTFVFLGADIDVWQSQLMGFASGNVVSYNKSNSKTAFAAMSASTDMLSSKIYGATDDTDLSSETYITDAQNEWNAAIDPDFNAKTVNPDEALADDLTGKDFFIGEF